MTGTVDGQRARSLLVWRIVTSAPPRNDQRALRPALPEILDSLTTSLRQELISARRGRQVERGDC